MNVANMKNPTYTANTMRLILQKHAHAKPIRPIVGLSSMNLVSLGFMGRKSVNGIIKAKERGYRETQSYDNGLTVTEQVSTDAPILDTGAYRTEKQESIYFLTHDFKLKLINKKAHRCGVGLLRRHPTATRTSRQLYQSPFICQLAYEHARS